MARERELRVHRVAPVGRDRRRDDCRSRRGDQRRARSRPARRAAPIASRSTTSCCASKKRSAGAAATPDARRSASSRRGHEPLDSAPFDSAQGRQGRSRTARSCRPRRLGPARRARRQRHQAGANADLSRAARSLPAFVAPGVRRRRRPAAGTDGQLRSRPHHDGRRPRRLSGSDAHRQEHSATAISSRSPRSSTR